MATGRKMKKIYDAMAEIFGETHKMLRVIHDRLVKLKFSPVNGQIIWDTKTSLGSAECAWLPYFQQLLFKKGVPPKCAVGVTVIFDNEENSIPFISCGHIAPPSNKTGRTGSDSLYYAGWWKAEGWKISPDPPLYHSEHKKPSGVVKRMTNYFLPLDALKSESEVVELIVKPLVSLHDGDQPAAANAIKRHAITVEQIRGDSMI